MAWLAVLKFASSVPLAEALRHQTQGIKTGRTTPFISPIPGSSSFSSNGATPVFISTSTIAVKSIRLQCTSANGATVLAIQINGLTVAKLVAPTVAGTNVVEFHDIDLSTISFTATNGAANDLGAVWYLTDYANNLKNTPAGNAPAVTTTVAGTTIPNQITGGPTQAPDLSAFNASIAAAQQAALAIAGLFSNPPPSSPPPPPKGRVLS